MADFNIIFQEDQFTFNDLTDYTDLTVTKTDLVITYPSITTSIEIVLDVYDENVSTKGDSFTFTKDNSSELATFIDGIYKFVLNIYNGSTLVETKILYVLNEKHAIYQYLLNTADKIMDKQCCNSWKSLSEIIALLELAKLDIANERYLEAQEYIDYINTIVDECQSNLC